MRKISELWSVGWSFSFFMVTNRSVVLYYSKVKGVALRDALLGYNNNYLRLENDADLSPVEGLFRPSTGDHDQQFGEGKAFFVFLHVAVHCLSYLRNYQLCRIIS